MVNIHKHEMYKLITVCFFLGIIQNPSYAGIVYRSLPNAVKENDGKSTNAVLDPILYNNLIDLREHMSDLNRQFKQVKEYVDDMKKWQIVMEEQLEKIAITSAKVSSSQTSRHEETVDDKIERALIRYNADKVGLVGNYCLLKTDTSLSIISILF